MGRLWLEDGEKPVKFSISRPAQHDARETRSDWNLPTSSPLPRLDLVEFGERPFKFVIEEPHRIKNFAEGCGCSCPVGLSKGEDAVVSQISHDPRVGNSIGEQVS